MEPLAHSARPEHGIPTQSYNSHISNVAARTGKNAKVASSYFKGNTKYFEKIVNCAAICHDLGKLDLENQRVLKDNSMQELPVKHEDAGAAYLLRKKCIPAAILASKHHQGLPSFFEEKKKKDHFLRNPEAYSRTEKLLADYIATHNQYVRTQQLPAELGKENRFWTGLRFRLALSCLVDGDHGDTAGHYGNETQVSPPACRWQERLNLLEQYTDGLFLNDPGSSRNILRQDIFHACKNAATEVGIIACDSPVGTGKTTAIMAHLLNVAIKKNLRHIIVVLPYTNIIKQSVETYRKALVLPGENKFEVVAEHHHHADFNDINARYLTTLWQSPIIVTTAVQFFETMAANNPARLRKFHELPGSAVFIDEVHSAIPAWMWPQVWQWMKALSDNWTCHFVLASGSLPRFWTFEKVAAPPECIPELLPEATSQEANRAESRRIKYFTIPEPFDRSGLIHFILSKTGPRLVIMNTVQSAAVIANELHILGHDVIHLSTALCPEDRDKVVDQIKQRLQKIKESKWTLVATSCVEAGMDFSFATAFRESCSVASLIQIGGRANRHSRIATAEIWDFRVAIDEPLLNQHPAFRVSKTVLADLFNEKKMNVLSSAELATEAMRREIMTDYDSKAGLIKDREDKFDYPEVAKLCRVIASDSKLVVVSPNIIKDMERREKVDHRELLRHSVQLWPQKIDYLALENVYGYQELYKMPPDQYSSFAKGREDVPCLGYMKGLLPLVYAQETGLII